MVEFRPAQAVIRVTCTRAAAPNISSMTSPPTDAPGPDRPELGLIALGAFAVAILCLVSFVVFGA